MFPSYLEKMANSDLIYVKHTFNEIKCLLVKAITERLSSHASLS